MGEFDSLTLVPYSADSSILWSYVTGMTNITNYFTSQWPEVSFIICFISPHGPLVMQYPMYTSLAEKKIFVFIWVE